MSEPELPEKNLLVRVIALLDQLQAHGYDFSGEERHEQEVAALLAELQAIKKFYDWIKTQ